MPVLISLSATCRLTGCGLLGPVDGAHAPLAEDFEQRVPAGDHLARRRIRRDGRPAAPARDRAVRVPSGPSPPGRQSPTAEAFPRTTSAVASWVAGEVRSDIPVASRLRGTAGPVVGGEQRLDPGPEFGVAAALAVQVGGTLRRGGEVRRLKEQGFRTCGVDGHGLPPE